MFQQVKPTLRSQQVAQQIRSAILTGQLLPGERLPAERDLAGQFGVSRITIRDAIRRLESAGLIQVKLGASGGAFVAEAANEVVSDALSNMLKLRRVDWHELAEARLVVEVAMVELAAHRANEEDLARLQTLLDEARAAIAQGQPFMSHSVAFHAALAAAAHNRALSFAVDSYSAVFHDALAAARTVTPAMPSLALRDHEALLEAIRARDGARARALMTEHLAVFAHAVSQGADGRPPPPEARTSPPGPLP